MKRNIPCVSVFLCLSVTASLQHKPLHPYASCRAWITFNIPSYPWQTAINHINPAPFLLDTSMYGVPGEGEGSSAQDRQKKLIVASHPYSTSV